MDPPRDSGDAGTGVAQVALTALPADVACIRLTENRANRIGRRVLPAGETTEFFVPTPHSGPGGITAGSDGNIWFTEIDGNKIGRLTLH